MSEITVNGLIFEIEKIDDYEKKEYSWDSEYMVLKGTSGLSRPVRNIPSEVEYNGKKYKVHKVDCAAMRDNQVLKSLSLPETVVWINGGSVSGGYGAFANCKLLSDVILPNSLKGIGEFSFGGDTAIEQMYFGDNLDRICYGAFKNCESLKEVDFGDKLQTIDSEAFCGCKSLQNVFFPSSLKSIGEKAFDGCTSIKEVNIPASVENVDDQAFANTGVKVVNIYSENVNIAADAFPSDAQINFLDANSYPKRQHKRRTNKEIETPKPAPQPKEEKVEKPAKEEKAETPVKTEKVEKAEKKSTVNTGSSEETQSPSANNANSKVRIYAKSQKWAAMGIIDAYTKMYPHATVTDLNKAFPKEQFAKADGRGLLETWDDLEKFAKSTETDFDDKQLVEWNESNYFLTLTNGQKISFTVPMWTKEMFEKLLGYAKLYDIEMAQYEAGEKGFGKRGEYRLEYLNGYVPPKPEKSKTWLWILIAVIVLAAAAFILFGGKKEVVKTVEVEKIVYVEKLEEIEDRFNAAEFEVGSAELNTDACIVLHDLAWVMEQQPNIRIRIEGHTSADGDPEFNQHLSQQRAQATVDYLIQKEHVDPSRLEAVGYGSSKLKNKANPQSPENRRTEIEVIK